MQHDDLFSQLLFCRRCQAGPEQINAYDFIPQGLCNLSQQPSRANHDPKVGSLIANDVSEMGARSQGCPEACEMSRHAAEIQPGDPVVHSLKAGRFPKLDSALFDGLCNALNDVILGDPSVVIIGFVHAARVRSYQSAFERAQIRLVLDETKQH